jgi:peptidyl-prolyl cis-trans isomerase SurA
MSIKLDLLLLFLFINIFVFSQTDKVLLTIDGKKIYKEEFKRAFSKDKDLKWINNTDSVKKYLDKFIEFKLIVTEAESLGLDKTNEYTNEANAFNNQLVRQYLTDKITLDFFVKQTYDRSKTEVRIKQILIRLDPNSSAKDSLFAYQKALNIRKKILNGGNFALIASQISDDPSAAVNGGDLWYVKPTMIPYAVENYIYSNTTEKISLPIRSNLGYHLIEILDKRPNPGRYKVSQIMLCFSTLSNDSTSAIKQKADSIYQLAINGADFGLLAKKYSCDKGTSLTGGELPWFETGKMPREFEEAAFKLKKDGDISVPIKTKYGWHIIKRISQEENPPFDKIKEQIYNLVLNSEKGKIATKIQIENLERQYGFKDYGTLSTFYSLVDSTIFDGTWKIPIETTLTGLLFSFSNQKFYQNDFAEFLEISQKKMYPTPILNYVNSKYEEFINESIIKFETNNIKNSNIEFISLSSRFKENLLSNYLMEKNVWTKVETDKNGLKDFYEKNKNLYNKMYIADVCIYSYSADKINKIEKQFNKIKDLNLSTDDLEKYMKENVDAGFVLSKCLKSEEGEDKVVDRCIDLYKNGKLKKDQRLVFFEDINLLLLLNKEINNTDKSLDEIRSKVTTDYQNYLESSWVKDLKKKYTVIVDQEVLESIAKN